MISFGPALLYKKFVLSHVVRNMQFFFKKNYLKKIIIKRQTELSAEVGSLTRQRKALKIRYQIVHRANLRYQKVWRTPQN